MPRQSTISLPAERADQLRKIAKLKNVSVSDLLEQFIIEQTAAVGIGSPDFGFILDRRTDLDISGVGITEGVQFGVHAAFLVALLPAEGHELIRAIETVLETGKRVDVRCREDRLTIHRQGRGLVINYERIRSKQKTECIPTSMTIGIARELLTRMRVVYGADLVK